MYSNLRLILTETSYQIDKYEFKNPVLNPRSRNNFSLSILVEPEFRLQIIKQSIPNQLLYISGVELESKKRLEHNYDIVNNGPSPTERLIIIFYIPTVKNFNDQNKKFELIKLETSELYVNDVTTTCQIVRNELVSKNYLGPHFEENLKIDSEKTDYINCSSGESIKCERLKCFVPKIRVNSTPIIVKLKLNLQWNNYYKLADGKKDLILYTSIMQIMCKPLCKNTAEFYFTHTMIYMPSPIKISIWITLSAILIGLGVLLIIAFVLYKVCRLTRFYNIQHHYIPTLKFMSPKEARARALHNVNINYAFQRIIPVLMNSTDGKLAKLKSQDDPNFGKTVHKQVARNLYYTVAIDPTIPKHKKVIEKIKALQIRKPLPGQYVYTVAERKSCLILSGDFEYAIRDGLICDVCIYEFKDKIQIKVRKCKNKFWKAKFDIKEHTVAKKELFYEGIGITSPAIEKTHHYGKFTMTVASIFEAKDKGANAAELEAMLIQAEKEKKEAETAALRKAQERKRKERLKAVLAGQDEDEEDALDEGKEFAPPIELDAEVDQLDDTEEVDDRLRQAGDDAIDQLPSIDEIPEVIDYLERGASFSINNVHGIHIKLDNNATRFIPGTLVRIEGNETFIPGQTFHTDEGTCYVPGFTVQLQREPKFVEGMILQDENEEACFVTGSGNVKDGLLKFRPAQLEISLEIGSSEEEEEDDEDKFAKKYAQMEENNSQPPPPPTRHEQERKKQRFTFVEMPKVDMDELRPKPKKERYEKKSKPVMTSYIKPPEVAEQERQEHEERMKKAKEAMQRLQKQQEKMDKETRIVQRMDNEIKEIEQMSATLSIQSKHMISNFGAKASQMYDRLSEIDNKMYSSNNDYQRPLPVIIPKVKKSVEFEEKTSVNYDKIYSVIADFGFETKIVDELSKIFCELIIFTDSFAEKEKVDIENMITADDSLIFANKCSSLLKSTLKNIIFNMSKTMMKENDNLKALFTGIDILLKTIIKYPRHDLIAELIDYQEQTKTLALLVSNLLKELCLKKTSPEVTNIQNLINSGTCSDANQNALIENTLNIFKKRDDQILSTAFQHLQEKVPTFKSKFYNEVQVDIQENVLTNIDEETDVRTIEEMVTDSLKSNLRKAFQERTEQTLNNILEKPEDNEVRTTFTMRCERISEAYGIKKDLYKKKSEPKNEEELKILYRKCVIMEDLATGKAPLKECIEKMISEPKAAKFDENARKLVRAAAVLLTTDEQLKEPLITSLEIPNKYFDNERLLCLEEYLAIRCIKTIDTFIKKEQIPYKFVVVLKRGLEAVTPIEADMLILSSHVPYFLIDERSIRYFKPVYTEKMRFEQVQRELKSNLKLKIDEHEAVEKAKTQRTIRSKKKAVEKPKIQLTTYECLAYKLPVCRMSVLLDTKMYEAQEKRRKQLENAFKVRLADRIANTPKPEEVDENGEIVEGGEDFKKKSTKKEKSVKGKSVRAKRSTRVKK